MHAHTDRDQFAPPRPPARLRAITLAVLVHAVLIGALTWGVNWKNTADQPAVEAELWAAVPTQAAPRAVEPPPPPPPPPVQQATPPAPPPPPVRAAEPPDTREADIAIEREKKRLEQEKKAREQQELREKRERERKEEERRERLEQEKKERQQKEREKEKEQREKQLAEQKKAEQEKQKKLAEDKRRKAEEAAREAKEADARHQANIRHMQGLANATGGETATGTALDSSGPSASYGGRVAAAVKPNIVFTENVAGNPSAEVEVRAAPDGTITSRRLLKSSGVRAWDEAVLRALDKTERLPKDTDGRVPPQFPMVFRPKD